MHSVGSDHRPIVETAMLNVPASGPERSFLSFLIGIVTVDPPSTVEIASEGLCDQAEKRNVGIIALTSLDSKPKTKGDIPILKPRGCSFPYRAQFFKMSKNTPNPAAVRGASVISRYSAGRLCRV